MHQERESFFRIRKMHKRNQLEKEEENSSTTIEPWRRQTDRQTEQTVKFVSC
jgi:hypothetical protein